jgi:hypothetical protein
VLSGTVTIAGRALREGQTACSDPAPGSGLPVLTLKSGDGDQPPS